MKYLDPKHNTENCKMHCLQLHAAVILMSNGFVVGINSFQKKLQIKRRNMKTGHTKKLDTSKWRIYYVHVEERFWSQALKQCDEDNQISKTKLTIVKL